MSSYKLDGWYIKKLYAHFDTPLSFEKAREYVSDPTKIQAHGFLPFLSFELKKRRIHSTPKLRPLKYASHVDGYIFSYYANLLSTEYERQVIESNLDSAVLAYRPGRGNNIAFAKEAFDSIVQHSPCVAIGFDIESFFDNIDHTELKHQWSVLIRQQYLPADHYAVYRALTKYSFIDRVACFDRLGYSRKRRARGGRICTIKDFRTKIRSSTDNLIQSNSTHHGIPQGSALSAILANIYMYTFDLSMQKLALELSGVYRRYSDDILFICSLDKEDLVKSIVKANLAKLGNQLTIQDNKTLITHFLTGTDGAIIIPHTDKPFQYLGFIFDGQKILLRSQTLSRFWRRAVGAVKKAKDDAAWAKAKGRSGQLFRRKLYRRFSHLGHRNFLTYAKRAAKQMEQHEYKNTAAWKQVKNHWNKLERLITTI